MTRPVPPAASGGWLHAPDHLVALVASLSGPPPRTPAGDPTAVQWYWQIRRVADQVWADGWLAGATDYAARMPARVEVTSEMVFPPAVAAVAERAARTRASVPASPRGRS